MTLNDTFGGRLAQARGLIGLSQSELAEQTGIAAAQISRYESGRNTPRPAIVAKLASALSVTMEWLNGDKGNASLKDLPERRKLEVLASYVEWCSTLNRDVRKSFNAFASAYEDEEGDGPEVDHVSGLDQVDPRYLSELYANWIIERPSRFPELADNSQSTPGTSALIEVIARHNANLAQLELDLHVEEMKAMTLAVNLRQALEIIDGQRQVDDDLLGKWRDGLIEHPDMKSIRANGVRLIEQFEKSCDELESLLQRKISPPRKRPTRPVTTRPPEFSDYADEAPSPPPRKRPTRTSTK
ncbi:MAG: helix-turn-helix domain-containing protein [Burkholderiaceae bacterium]|nr:helix-turn-helix domain-containing protein [Burkholderiaceae bacterium]